MRTQHACLFRLSTAVIQVCFNDGTEVYLCTDTKVVSYKSKRAERRTYSMEEAYALELEFDGPHVRKKTDYNQEFIKRMKYAKEII